MTDPDFWCDATMLVAVLCVVVICVFIGLLIYERKGRD